LHNRKWQIIHTYSGGVRTSSKIYIQIIEMREE
jgi:hypothetical protein